MPLKILYVVNVSWFFISHRIFLAERALTKNWLVSVFTKVEGDVRPLNQKKISLKNWNVTRGISTPIGELRAFYELYREVRKSKPDIIHVVGMKPIISTSVSLFFCKNKVLVLAVSGLGAAKMTGTSGKFISGLSAVLIQRLATRNISGFIFQNRADLEFGIENFSASPQNCLVTFGSGVDLSLFSLIRRKTYPHHDFKILIACRMLWEKGVGAFVEAAAKINLQHPNVRFIIAGAFDPESPSAIPSKVLSDWDQLPFVEWLGHVGDIPALMADADAFVYPSTYGEGIPKVLLEACASGLPIVTNNWPGCSDVVVDGVNGFLVEPGSVDALVDAINKLVSNRSLTIQFGQSSRKMAEDNFSVEKVTTQTFDFYDRLLKQL